MQLPTRPHFLPDLETEIELYDMISWDLPGRTKRPKRAKAQR